MFSFLLLPTFGLIDCKPGQPLASGSGGPPPEQTGGAGLALAGGSGEHCAASAHQLHSENEAVRQSPQAVRELQLYRVTLGIDVSVGA